MQRFLSSMMLTGLLWALSLLSVPEQADGPAAIAQSQPLPTQAMNHTFYPR